MLNNSNEVPECPNLRLPKLEHGPVDLLLTNGANERPLFLKCDLDAYTASKEKLAVLQSAFTDRRALQPALPYGTLDWEFFDHEANHKLTFLARRIDFPLPYSPEHITRIPSVNGMCFRSGCNVIPTGHWRYNMVSIFMCWYMLLNSVNRKKKSSKLKLIWWQHHVTGMQEKHRT
jgi:hypothetical protein